MFKYKKETYDVSSREDEFYYEVLMKKIFKDYSPFEVCDGIEFPHKNEIGGVILKYVGGGAAFFKVQRQMPDEDELNSIFEICEFMQKNYGKYVVVRIICEPHIEIFDIDVSKFDDFDIVYASSRKNDGDECLDSLITKLENNEEFEIVDFIKSITSLFMSRSDEKVFQEKYSLFNALFSEKNMDIPSSEELNSFRFAINPIFGR